MSKIVVKKVCQFCGKEFIAHKLNTMYCSHQCARQSYKSRLREQKLEKVLQKDNLPPVSTTTLKKEYLSCDDVADLMGVSSTTVYRYCITGKIKCIKMNRKIFIRKEDIDALFQVETPYQVRHIQAKPVTEYYTVNEIVKKYNVSKDTIFKYAASRNIPRIKQGNKTLFSKIHIDRRFSLYSPDPAISEWYSVDEICEKYEMSVHAVYSCASNYIVPRMKSKGKCYYSKKHIDEILANRATTAETAEWYSMEDINRIYGLDPRYVSGLIYKNPIPKIRRGNKGYYSKTHFDELMRNKFPQPEYCTVEEVTSKYGITRDALYQYIKRYNVSTIKEGRYIKILKHEIEKVLSNTQKAS